MAPDGYTTMMCIYDSGSRAPVPSKEDTVASNAFKISQLQLRARQRKSSLMGNPIRPALTRKTPITFKS